MKTRKLIISPIGEIINPDHTAAIARAVEHLVEYADEDRPTEQWASVLDEADENGNWHVLQSDYHRMTCKTLSTHSTREAAEAEAERINRQLFEEIAAGLTSVEVPEYIDPYSICIGRVESGTYPQSRRCRVQIRDAEITVHWETVHVGDRHLNTAKIKSEIEKHFAKLAESANT